MNAGLILAGGKGERLIGYDRPKQYIEVGEKMVITYCLEIFAASPDIGAICVVADEEWRGKIGNYIYADSGISRQHSIYCGLQALKSHAPKNVIIHDSARPCVTAEDIERLLAASGGYDGATPSLPVTETVYRSYNGKSIAETLKRDELFIGQTPECYDFAKYIAANERFRDMLGDFRGSSEIAVKSGMKIALAKGNPGNFKITTNSDLERFSAQVRKGTAR